jgi:hypothetical protein
MMSVDVGPSQSEWHNGEYRAVSTGIGHQDHGRNGHAAKHIERQQAFFASAAVGGPRVRYSTLYLFKMVSEHVLDCAFSCAVRQRANMGQTIARGSARLIAAATEAIVAAAASDCVLEVCAWPEANIRLVGQLPEPQAKKRGAYKKRLSA